jgi:hypothetical protein
VRTMPGKHADHGHPAPERGGGVASSPSASSMTRRRPCTPSQSGDSGTPGKDSRTTSCQTGDVARQLAEAIQSADSLIHRGRSRVIFIATLEFELLGTNAISTIATSDAESTTRRSDDGDHPVLSSTVRAISDDNAIAQPFPVNCRAHKEMRPVRVAADRGSAAGSRSDQCGCPSL